MDLSLAARINDLQNVIYTLSLVIVGLCCYIVSQPTNDRPKAVPHCPLHRCSPDKCADRHKLDE